MTIDVGLLHDTLRGAAESRPDAVAVQDESDEVLTYRELETLSNQWAHYVREAKTGSRREHPYVGVLAPVSPTAIAAVVGVLKAGFAYVPLDDRSPTARLCTVAEQAGIDLLIADPAMLDGRDELAEHPALKDLVLCGPDHRGRLGHVRERATHPVEDPGILTDDLAYVLYTSGSTGTPKGIMHTHRSACAFVSWMQKEFQLTSSDIVMSRAPWHFDLSVFDVFNTLAAGATVVTYDWTRSRRGDLRHQSYVALLERSRASVLYTTPSTFVALMERGGLGERPTRLRQLMYAGEPFPVAQLRRLRHACPGVRVANIYGPTETNIITCQWVDEPGASDGNAVPLGREVDDVEILVVHDSGRLCAPGEVGELWCRGAQVTLGYLGAPEQTAEQLVRSPFHVAPAWFWRTGDLAVRDVHGVLHYRGRRDHMVKISGFRVELGDVEAAASTFAELEAFTAVAVQVGDSVADKQLHAFYTIAPHQRMPAAELREHLARLLPRHMVPLTLRQLDTMPMTSSGKADRAALAEIARHG
ncbi:amino acid adenylation domain-containing protein [Amycolatopsis japonica]